LKALFVNTLQVECQPSIDDYLPSLTRMNDLKRIWEVIEIITELAIEQHKEDQVQGKSNNDYTRMRRTLIVRCILAKFREMAFIPCMEKKYYQRMKCTGELHYPHDSKIAELFADKLSIIQLPSKALLMKRMFSFSIRKDMFRYFTYN
jgi:hypothetical protein